MKVKLLSSDAKAPTMAYQSDAGFDVYSPIVRMLMGVLVYKNSFANKKIYEI